MTFPDASYKRGFAFLSNEVYVLKSLALYLFAFHSFDVDVAGFIEVTAVSISVERDFDFEIVFS